MLMNVRDSLLRSNDVPDTVAGHQNKLTVLVDALNSYLRDSSHCVSVCRIFIIFELKIAQSSREGQATINSAICYIVSRLLNSLELIRIVWLVVI